MTVTIKFIQQYTNEDVNRCIDDIESSGGEAIVRSYYESDNYVDVYVNISDVTEFDLAFKKTISYQYSDY